MSEGIEATDADAATCDAMRSARLMLVDDADMCWLVRRCLTVLRNERMKWYYADSVRATNVRDERLIQSPNRTTQRLDTNSPQTHNGNDS